MKKILSLWIFFFPIAMLAQVDYSVDIIFSPEQTYRTLSPDENLIVQVRNENEVKKFGYRYGINFNLHLGSSAAIKTGIRMLESGYNSIHDDLFFDYKFLEVPFGVRYYYTEGMLRPFTEIGGSANFYLSGFDNSNQEINSTNFSAYVSMGLDYVYSNNLSIFLQPIFRYHTTETVKNVLIEEHLYSAGIELGFRLKF